MIQSKYRIKISALFYSTLTKHSPRISHPMLTAVFAGTSMLSVLAEPMTTSTSYFSASIRLSFSSMLVLRALLSTPPPLALSGAPPSTTVVVVGIVGGLLLVLRVEDWKKGFCSRHGVIASYSDYYSLQ